jgi:hypothetical protein
MQSAEATYYGERYLLRYITGPTIECIIYHLQIIIEVLPASARKVPALSFQLIHLNGMPALIIGTYHIGLYHTSYESRRYVPEGSRHDSDDQITKRSLRVA